MEKVNILVIGAGVVGLAIAKELSSIHEDVVVLEKEKSFGRHTSSRNSEVIHSGIYYPKGSLKARLCVEGAKLLYDYAKVNQIDYNNCGKLIVATKTEEFSELDRLLLKGQENGVEGLRLISESEIRYLESQVKATKALFVPSTGIIDTHKLMESFESAIEQNDGFVIYNSQVLDITKTIEGYKVASSDGEIYLASSIINSAGLFSDKISDMVGIDSQEYKNKIYFCKGEYYKDNTIKDINHLIYPVPDPNGIFLGIHLTINLNGEVRFGPNAYYLEDKVLDYRSDETRKNDFFEAISRYLDINIDNLHFDDCGVRPKIQGPKDQVRDFYIKEESEKGFIGFVNLIGIESPGLTCCLAIAEYVSKLI